MSNVTIFDTAETIATIAAKGITSWKKAFERQCSGDSAILAQLLANVLSKQHPTTKSLGDALEELSHYLLENSGLFSDCKRNIANDIHQIDHWGEFTPLIACYIKDYLKINDFGFIGESKNHAEKINVDVVYKTEAIKQKLDISVGAYFTREGIKGDGFSSAKGYLTEKRLKENKISVVFVKEDFDYLVSNPAKFASLFYEKLVLMKLTYDSAIKDYSKI